MREIRDADNPLMSVGEVAEAVSVSRATVYRHITRGTLRAFRDGPGGAIRIPADAVRALLLPAHRDVKSMTDDEFDAFLASRSNAELTALPEDEFAALLEEAKLRHGRALARRDQAAATVAEYDQ